MAVSDRLEDALVTIISALGLTLGTGPSEVDVVVQRKKAPKVERGLETTPLIQVTAAAMPGKNEWWDTGTADTPFGRKKNEYVVEVTMSAPGNRDPNTEEDTYRDWREEITRCIEPPSALGVDELFTINVDVGPQYDREGFARNYDQSRIYFRCVTVETAANA